MLIQLVATAAEKKRDCVCVCMREIEREERKMKLIAFYEHAIVSDTLYHFVICTM